MSISRLASGRWRAQVYDPARGHNVTVSSVLGPDYASFRTKTEAKAAREEARKRVAAPRSAITVAQFRERWLTDPLFARPKESTMVRNAELTKAFVASYGHLALHSVDDRVVGEWLAGGKQQRTVMALSAMWNDAASAKAGRLVERNPWAKLGISRGPGNKHKPPPSEEMVETLLACARRISGPYFAAWLAVGAYTGLRCGELDSLTWEAIDLERGRIAVDEQFNGTVRKFTAPKNGERREAVLTAPARAILLGLPRTAPVMCADGKARAFCFVTGRGDHWTKSARAYHWKAVRAAAGYTGTCYLATRHFAGWYMVNVLELPSEDVAIALGHTDGGELVRKLYGHREKGLALDRVARAYGARDNVRKLRVVGGGAA